MGYNLHITRKDFWAVEVGPAISLDEWQEYVALDEEIKEGLQNSWPDAFSAMMQA